MRRKPGQCHDYSKFSSAGKSIYVYIKDRTKQLTQKQLSSKKVLPVLNLSKNHLALLIGAAAAVVLLL